MKKIISLLIVFAVVFSGFGVFASDIRTSPNTTVDPTPVSPSTPTQMVSKVTFSDVDANTANGRAIYKLVNAGILNGYTDGTFRPNNPITRAELCKVINLAFNYTEADETGFTDVKKEDWFYSYVLIAKKAGYITGHANGTFKGNDYLTREQACAVVTRVAKPYDLTMTEKITDTVSEWAVPYVNKIVANKLMSLEEGGKFRATENITRAELVAVISNFVIVNTDETTSENVTQYTVTFNTNGGSAMVSTKVDSGRTVAEPGDPTKAGYTFDGWYTDSALTKPYDFNTTVTANITLYAKWTKTTSAGGGGGGGGSGGSGGTTSTTKCTVTFNTNGGSAIDNVTVNKGDSVDEPNAPERYGYIFKGWYENSGLTTEYNFSLAITKNTTIYAKWAVARTVTFETNGGEYIEPVIVEHGKTLSEPYVAEWPGYYFMGWYKEPEFIGKYNFSNVVYKDITIYAKWLEEDPAKKEEVVKNIKVLLEGDDENKGVNYLVDEFEGSQHEILLIVQSVMKNVLDDAEAGIPIYDGDYILEHYGEEISDANDLYDGMSKDEQSNFYSVLLQELGEEKTDNLLQTIFGIDISDAKDRIDK